MEVTKLTNINALIVTETRDRQEALKLKNIINQGASNADTSVSNGRVLWVSKEVDPDVSKRYKIDSYPTIIFYDPENDQALITVAADSISVSEIKNWLESLDGIQKDGDGTYTQADGNSFIPFFSGNGLNICKYVPIVCNVSPYIMLFLAVGGFAMSRNNIAKIGFGGLGLAAGARLLKKK